MMFSRPPAMVSVNRETIFFLAVSSANAEILQKIKKTNIEKNYRSKIFYITENQKKVAEKILNKINEKFKGKIATKISKEKNYCKAEEYHQKYFQKKSEK